MNKADKLFEVAFDAMQEKVDELGLKGVSMAAFLEDTSSIDWKMATRVMGILETPREVNPGWNIVAMAGSKIAESMLIHAPSGHCFRKEGLKHGEVGFGNAEEPINGQGAEFLDLGGSYCACSFSGGPSEQDYMVACAGVQAIKKALG